jgi:hypothetical protein
MLTIRPASNLIHSEKFIFGILRKSYVKCNIANLYDASDRLAAKLEPLV